MNGDLGLTSQLSLVYLGCFRLVREAVFRNKVLVTTKKEGSDDLNLIPRI